MKKVMVILSILILLVMLIYASYISSIPESIVLFQGEEFSFRTFLGLNLENKVEETIETSSNLQTSISENTGKTNLSVKLGSIPVKDVSVTVIPKTVVIPGGDTIGLKLYTSGVLVVGMSEITGEDSKKYKPYEKTGMEEGDMIVAINEKSVTCTNDLITLVNASNRKRNQYQVFKRRGRTIY